MQEEQAFIQQLLDPKTQNKAFEQLLKEYQKPLYHHIRNIVLNHDDTDDVLQNTFIKVFRYLKDFKGDSKLFSWMYRIATNEALTFLSQKAKKNNLSSQELQEKTIQNLQSDVYFEELKYEEISEILGTSVGGLKASYHHATKKIEAFVTEN